MWVYVLGEDSGSAARLPIICVDAIEDFSESIQGLFEQCSRLLTDEYTNVCMEVFSSFQLCRSRRSPFGSLGRSGTFQT